MKRKIGFSDYGFIGKYFEIDSRTPLQFFNIYCNLRLVYDI